MAKKIDTRKLQDAIRAVIPEIKAPANMRKYGDMSAAMIKLRTRLGSGVDASGDSKKALKRLADSTKESRKAKKKKGKLSELTTPNRSNLTETGQLLDSVGVTKSAYGSVTVSPSGSRTDGKTNQKVAEYVTDGGRPFNNLSKIEIKRLSEEVKRDLREAIKKRLT